MSEHYFRELSRDSNSIEIMASDFAPLMKVASDNGFFDPDGYSALSHAGDGIDDDTGRVGDVTAGKLAKALGKGLRFLDYQPDAWPLENTDLIGQVEDFCRGGAFAVKLGQM